MRHLIIQGDGRVARLAALAFLLAATPWLLVSCGGSGNGGDACAPLDLDAEQMQARMIEMLSTADTLDRHRLAIALADALDEDNLPGAIAGLDANLDRIDPHEVRIIAHAWAAIDAKGALDHMLENWKFPRINNQAVEEVVYVWAASGDGAGARAYVDPTFDGPIASPRSPTRFMQLAVLKALAVAEDWEQLTGLFGSIDDDGDRAFWLTRVIVEMSRVNGFESIRSWVDGIPWDAPNDLKVEALKRALDWRSRLDYADAQSWYESFEGHPKAYEMLPEAVRAQGMREPANALEWLREREHGNTRDTLVREIVRGWLGRESGEIRNAGRVWVDENAADEFWQPMIVGVAVKHYADSVEHRRAADLARKYPEASLASKVVPSILAAWSTYDPEAVDEYIEVTGLGGEMVEEYQAKLEQRRTGIRVSRSRVEDDSAENQGEER